MELRFLPHIFVWGSCFPPHLCVGFLFLVLYPAAFSSSSSSRRLPSSHIQLVITQLTHNSTHTQLAHIQLNSHNLLTHTTQLTHNLLTYHTYNLSSYNLLKHNSTHTQLAHTYNLSSYNWLTHNSTHTHNLLTCNSNNSTHTQLAHMQLNSHNLSSHNLLTHNLPYSYITHTHTHTRVIKQLVHTHTQLVLPDIHLRDRRGTWRHPPSFHVAGVALGHIHIRFTWQAWHLRHWAGSGGAPGSQLTPWTPRLFAWQAWHLVTSTFTLRGRRGTR